MKNNDLIKLIETHGIKNSHAWPMMYKHEIFGVIYHLNKVLAQNLEGDVVELGCNIGTTSLYIKRLLNLYKSDKAFHVYDSWEGLPKKLDADQSPNTSFGQGSCKTNKSTFISTFKSENLETPIIHSGWFKEINDEEYPEKIFNCLFTTR